jgi:hypothetical protein
VTESAKPVEIEHRLRELLAVAEAAQLLIDAPSCEKPFASFGHETCTASGDACDLHRWHELRHALTLLNRDAALEALSAVEVAQGEVQHLLVLD